MNRSKEKIIKDLIDGCSISADTYYGYIKSNWPRIYADFMFIRENTPQNAKILDIGGVPPLLSALLRNSEYTDVSIADPFPANFEGYLKKQCISAVKMDVLNGTGELAEDQYDLVCFNEVVEHLAGNLLTALERVSKLVSQNGHLLVTTPNLRSLSGLVSLLVYSSGLASKPKESVKMQFDRKSSDYGYYGHVREYTSREVIELVESMGFVLVKKRFQPNYLKNSRLMRIVGAVEYLTPRYRLFGKYLFRKL